MTSSVPGYPTPVQDEGLDEVRNGRDTENSKELALDAEEVPERLPSISRRQSPAPERGDTADR